MGGGEEEEDEEEGGDARYLWRDGFEKPLYIASSDCGTSGALFEVSAVVVLTETSMFMLADAPGRSASCAPCESGEHLSRGIFCSSVSHSHPG